MIEKLGVQASRKRFEVGPIIGGEVFGEDVVFMIANGRKGRVFESATRRDLGDTVATLSEGERVGPVKNDI